MPQVRRDSTVRLGKELLLVISRIVRNAGRILPRSARWRLGRALYMDARGEVPNDMNQNGELNLQRAVLEMFRQEECAGRRRVVFDIGASRGDWTDHLLRSWRSGPALGELDLTIVAFEPHPATASILRRRFSGIDDVVIEKLGMSSKDGVAKLYTDSYASGVSSLHDLGRTDSFSVEVIVDTLTGYCEKKGLRGIEAMVKCDVEGHDFEVILRAMDMFEREEIAVFQFEYNQSWVFARRFLKDVFDAVESLPYAVGKVQPQYVVVFDHWNFELDRFFEGNYVLVHQRCIPWLPVRWSDWDGRNVMRLKRAGRQRGRMAGGRMSSRAAGRR